MSLLSILLASLLGSVHCAAMCGGFAAIAADRQERVWSATLAYNSGRLATYCVLGMIAGFVGSSLDTVGSLVGIARTSALILGLFLIGYGIARLFWGPSKGSVGNGLLHSTFGKLYPRLMRTLPHDKPILRAFGIGLLSTLLPCGWLYGFAAVAATTGDPLAAVFVMGVFWVGTLPIMVSLGTVARELLSRWGAQVPAVSSALLIAAGVFSVAAHLGLGGHHHGAHTGNPPVNIERLSIPSDVKSVD